MAAIDGRESFTRRDAYRRLIADSSSLPPDFLQRLDLKRKALDDSIHKFIATKERELKQWIKQERTLHRQQTQEREVKIEHARSRTGSDSTQDTMDSPYLPARRPGSHGLLLGSLRRDGEEGSAVALDEDEARGQVDARAIEAGIADRRASLERDREFLGVFTPAFLPAFADDAPSSVNALEDTPEKISSGKSTSNSSDPAATAAVAESSNRTEDSDALHEMEAKRPAHLLLSKRFSSTGSSSERLLTSALKSPTEHKPKRKRVSIALGTTIVAPSDSVPMSMDYHSTHSHSLQRISISDDESSHAGDDDTNTLSDADISTPGTSASPNISASIPIRSTDQPSDNRNPSKSVNSNSSSTTTAQSNPASSSKRHIDPDGDLFDLEDSDSDLDLSGTLSPGSTAAEPLDTTLAGRVGVDRTGNLDAVEDPQNWPSEHDEPRPLLLDPDDPARDPEQDREDPATTLGPITSEDGNGIAFRPTSVQSPMSPGFRRPPSYVRDPSYMKPPHQRTTSSSLLSASINGSAGSSFSAMMHSHNSNSNAFDDDYDDGYARAQRAAVSEEIYGSSYARPTSKGSFSAGSLGESYMARNAEVLRRLGGGGSSSTAAVGEGRG
jgi:hypothetical protein